VVWEEYWIFIKRNADCVTKWFGLPDMLV